MLVTLQQVGQWLDQFVTQALAKTDHWQQATALQAQRLGLEGLIHMIGLGQRGVQQAVAEAVALQRVKDEGFFIGQRHFGGFEEHFQTLAEEMFDGVA